MVARALRENCIPLGSHGLGWGKGAKEKEGWKFWRLKNFMTRDKSPFSLTGLDKITLFAFFLTHCKSDLLADTICAGGGTHHPTVVHEGERQAEPDRMPSFCTA